MLEDLAAFICNEMSELEIYRDGRHRQTADPARLEEVKQKDIEESKIDVKIAESINIETVTKSHRKTKNVFKEDSRRVICINKKEALGLC